MNVASLLHDQYKKIPNRLAVSVPKRVSGKYQYTDYTFKELENRCNQYANVFKSNPPEKIPSLPFITSAPVF